jgi:hypothetical protein
MNDKTPPFTRSDIEIEYWTAEWGAPCAFLTVKRPGSFYDGQRYGLRSAKGLEHATKRSDWQYLVDREPLWSKDHEPTTRMDEFFGSMGTDNLEKAIDGLLAGLTKWDLDQRDRSQIATQLSELSEALRELDEWNPIRTEVTLRSRWPRARELFLQVEMTLFEPPMSKVPDPPMWRWCSRVALLDVPSVDGRTLRSSGRYVLHDGGPAQLMSLSKNCETSDWVGTVDSLQGDGKGGLWAFGMAVSRDLARQLIDGHLFASIALEEPPDSQLGGTSWDGGTVRNAVVLPADQHPWRF